MFSLFNVCLSYCSFYVWGIPLFADLETNTYGIDPESVEKLISPRTKAIMVVHFWLSFKYGRNNENCK